MGFFSGLDAEQYDRQYSDKQLVRRMAHYFDAHMGKLWVIGLLALSSAVTAAAVPLLLARALDELGEQISPEAIWLVVGVVFLSGFLSWATNWWRRRLTARTIGDVILTIRLDGFKAAMSHDLSFYDENPSGKVVSRITSDTREYGDMIVLITDLISQFGQALIVGAALIAINWRLSLYLFGMLPIVYWIATLFREAARRTTRTGMRAMGNVNAVIKETISGIAVAKNFRQEEAIFKEFDHGNQSSFDVNLRRGFVLSMVFPALNALAALGTALLLYVGGMNVAASVITAGAWYLFLQGLDRFWFPVLNLSAFWTQLQSGLAAAERSFALIDAEPRVVQVGKQRMARLRGDIRFEQVNFSYVTGEPILRDFSLHIKPGETVALVGHTGAGKTSIAKLVNRFYEFQEGQLLIDGKDIRSLDLTAYRRQLGIVSQVPFLFDGTVAENIRYAAPGVKDPEILRLARKIGKGEWLETLPDGLKTEVGERGARLSMGQRQLVSLLRVLVQKPAIFVLDEATASIDPFTEWQIQQALDMILSKSTSILIAHRLSTVKAADRIIVLREGRIIEEGDHDGLLAQGGHYATLYNTYFRHQSLAYVEESRKLAK
ncbi:MAG TPA: ABC transporter ATP-binding protein [Anaerolineales bacterium]|nr:ABC transporter ATP-binding protein [Anaerolineales bacterium]HRQ92410.1 ABC transporter ATP-binding protein [Anaerolineales bacterium]